MKFCAASFHENLQKTRYAKRRLGGRGDGGGVGGELRGRVGGGSQSEGRGVLAKPSVPTKIFDIYLTGKFNSQMQTRFAW